MLKLGGEKLLVGNRETKESQHDLIKLERRGWRERRKKYIAIENIKHSVKIKSCVTIIILIIHNIPN